MKKRIFLIVASVTALLIGISTFYFLYIVPQQHVTAEPVELVMIPDIFQRYTQEITQADQFVSTHPELFRSAAPVTLEHVYGFFDIPLHQTIRIHKFKW